MKKIQYLISIFAIIVAVIAIYFVLSDENALLAHPKGPIAKRQLEIIIDHILLMLVIVVPTLIMLFVTVWKFHGKNTKAEYDPDHSYGAMGVTLMWVVPSIVIAIMAAMTWYSTVELDPHRPIKSDVKPMTIQVVGINWKWLFIYPEQEIATVNFVQFPEKTPIHFVLTSDNSPINSFWIAQLSGQIYAMSGMTTPIHMMANEPGEYSGRAAEINGEGLASMTFVAKSSTKSDFDKWVAKVKQSPMALNDQTYEKLLEPTVNHPVELYSSVKPNLFNQIIEKYSHPMKK